MMKIHSTSFKNWNWPLLIIISVASILRLWNLNSMPYLHDEISALNRTFFSNFSDLIEYGVKTTDTHPPLVQIWLFYYTKIFGYEEWIVKLPFIIIGIASLFYLYRLTKKWSNETVALLVIALFSVSQFHIMHSQMIRMYIPGFFFVIQFIYFWSEWVFFKNDNRRTLVYYVLFGILAALTHHFSLFAVLLAAIFGLFYIKKQNLFKYIGVNLLIPILYLPNINVFLYQFGIGGIGGPDGWLGSPENDFIVKFIEYIFDFSWTLFAVIFIAMIYGTFRFKKDKSFNWKIVVFSFFLFFTTFIVAFLYSKYKNPVLQYSTLLFVAPFFFIGLFQSIKEQKKWFNFTFVILISIIGSYELIFNRLHYHLFYTSGFEESLIVSNHLIAENSENSTKTICIIGLDKGKTNFYSKIGRHKPSKEIIFLEKGEFMDLEEFEQKIRSFSTQNCQISYFYAEVIPLAYKQIIEKYFPTKVKVTNYYLFRHIIYSKEKSKVNYLSNIHYSKNWSNSIKDKNQQIILGENSEWGPGFKSNFADLNIRSVDDIIVFTTIKVTDLNQDISLVSLIQKGDSTISYATCELKQVKINNQDSTVNLSCFVPVSSFNKGSKEYTFSTFIWNKSKKKLIVKEFYLQKEEGNPYLYGLMEPIKN